MLRNLDEKVGFEKKHRTNKRRSRGDTRGALRDHLALFTTAQALRFPQIKLPLIGMVFEPYH